MENKELEKKKFIEWLSGLIKDEFKTDHFFDVCWREAIEMENNGLSFEIDSHYTIKKRPYLFRLS